MQERLQLNKNKYKPAEWKSYPFPLTEVLVCGECGKHLGGKSGHGRNGKHFYYGHSRRLNSDGITHLKRCKLETVRAPKIEEIILGSLKKVLHDPALLKTWLDIYAKKNSNELPALEGRLQNIENDIATNQRRIENLTARLADLPPEVSADPIYKQIQEFTLKLKELERVKADLSVQTRSLNTGVVDRSELLFRIKRTINALEKVPAEDRRPIYANLIKFAELHPTKIRLGVYAPTVPAAHAAVASGSNVAGSCTDLNGSEGGT